MSVAALGALTEMAATAPRQDDAHSRITRQVQAKEAMVRALLAGCGYMSLRDLAQRLGDTEMASEGGDVDIDETKILLEKPESRKRKREEPASKDDMSRVLVFTVPPKGSPRVLIKCRHCGKAVNGRSEMINHVRTHTGEKPHKCSFPGCSKSFAHSSNLHQHERSH